MLCSKFSVFEQVCCNGIRIIWFLGNAQRAIPQQRRYQAISTPVRFVQNVAFVIAHQFSTFFSMVVSGVHRSAIHMAPRKILSQPILKLPPGAVVTVVGSTYQCPLPISRIHHVQQVQPSRIPSRIQHVQQVQPRVSGAPQYSRACGSNERMPPPAPAPPPVQKHVPIHQLVQQQVPRYVENLVNTLPPVVTHPPPAKLVPLQFGKIVGSEPIYQGEVVAEPPCPRTAQVVDDPPCPRAARKFLRPPQQCREHLPNSCVVACRRAPVQIVMPIPDVPRSSPPPRAVNLYSLW